METINIKIVKGTLVLILGILVTSVSYYAAKHGGLYIIAVAPIVFGVLVITRG